MLPMRVRNAVNLLNIFTEISTESFIDVGKHFPAFYTTGSTCSELPIKRKKSERKPLVTSVNDLKREARLRRKERQKVQEVILQPPKNGLLVKGLVPVARQVYSARAKLHVCVSRVVKNIAIYTCSLCGEVHVGHPPHRIRTCNVAGSPTNKEHTWEKGGIGHVLPVVESFHLYDRIGRAVSHNERLEVDRIPALLELCVQAGVDIPEYPTRRRACPIYSLAGRVIDFERRFPKEDSPGKDINTYGFWDKKRNLNNDDKFMDLHSDDIQAISVQGMEEWEKMRSGASKLMEKYAVQTCGYCSEVQVGPKGHRVRNCQAFKHQMRDGQHAWQEATVDDLIPPVYVWHVRDGQRGELLVNGLKRYYGMLPAVVELFAQAGAYVGDHYAGVMREDVAVPDLDEEKLVV
ncbi:APO protein 3, mitochondrial-like [Juglans microcarpa x Juglans regia]|uniref:APO protein 3, mitochondrial-like n=1 Tax=Juglans microcarpa x Juglans regia TaxID=2249226 RepID=UPI001B7EA18F|nr:APO protein 3, mitochondrial-like [Juglans microcarpa x Juglans regia]XP_041018739.1 APO protein 3, mitochondrial-like [Juglans microcarpa x Juglans regia]